MIITAQDYINLIVLLLAYGALTWVIIGIAVLLRNKFWVDPITRTELNKLSSNHITTEYEQTRINKAA